MEFKNSTCLLFVHVQPLLVYIWLLLLLLLDDRHLYSDLFSIISVAGTDRGVVEEVRSTNFYCDGHLIILTSSNFYCTFYRDHQKLVLHLFIFNVIPQESIGCERTRCC